MGVLAKVALSIVIVVVGAVISGIVKEVYEFGNYFVILIAVLIVMYIWNK
jgi:NhaP-type Na+/H+ or K+/H+ antiporter